MTKSSARKSMGRGSPWAQGVAGAVAVAGEEIEAAALRWG
jgi:hypothetical protein